jgi:predicted N-acetyltransferase YhbS
MITVRPYKKRDYEEIKKILKEAKMFDKTWESQKNFSKMTEKDPESVLVAVKNEKVVGNIFIFASGWESMIFRLAVQKKHRRKGIGKKLLEEAQKKSRKKRSQ